MAACRRNKKGTKGSSGDASGLLACREDAVSSCRGKQLVQLSKGDYYGDMQQHTEPRDARPRSDDGRGWDGGADGAVVVKLQAWRRRR